MHQSTPTRPLCLLLTALTTVYVLAACGPGDPGPQGALGATGPAGPAGSANVTQINYTTAFTPSSSGKLLTLPASIDKATIEKSLLVVYVQNVADQSLWYQLPGLVVGDAFRYYVSTSATERQTVTIVRDSGTAVMSISGVRILIIPAADVINGDRAGIDYKDYRKVKLFYGLHK